MCSLDDRCSANTRWFRVNRSNNVGYLFIYQWREHNLDIRIDLLRLKMYCCIRQNSTLWYLTVIVPLSATTVTSSTSFSNSLCWLAIELTSSSVLLYASLSDSLSSSCADFSSSTSAQWLYKRTFKCIAPTFNDSQWHIINHVATTTNTPVPLHLSRTARWTRRLTSRTCNRCRHDRWRWNCLR
jgi:hypothetical protein